MDGRRQVWKGSTGVKRMCQEAEKVLSEEGVKSRMKRLAKINLYLKNVEH
jgi:hypothetical protein